MKAAEGHWWQGVPGVLACVLCACPIQRTAGGTVATGMTAHFKTVHPNHPRSS